MFKDWDEVPEYLKPKIARLVEIGWVHGYPDGTIRIHETITMERFINFMDKVLERFEEAADYDREQLTKRVANFIVGIQSAAGTGAGVVIGPGKVLTCAHVVEGVSQASVRWTSPYADHSLPRMWTGPWPVTKRNSSTDLALIEVGVNTMGASELAEELVSPQFSEVDKANFGKSLYTQGSPLGHHGKLTRGLYSGHTFNYGGIHLLTTIPSNPGNSGGPVFDLSGRLVGIVTAKPLLRARADNEVWVPADDMSLLVPPIAIKQFLTS